MRNYIDVEKIKSGDIGMIMIFEGSLGSERIAEMIAAAPFEQPPEDILSVETYCDVFARFFETYVGAYYVKNYVFKYTQFSSAQGLTTAVTFLQLCEFPVFGVFKVDKKSLVKIGQIADAHAIMENTLDALSAVLQQRDVYTRMLKQLYGPPKEKKWPPKAKQSMEGCTERYKPRTHVRYDAEQIMRSEFREFQLFVKTIAEQMRAL